jgi:valyl-tRNA synthetase
LGYAQGFLNSVEKKLSNEKFVNSAPPQVLANEQKKKQDALQKIENINQSIQLIKDRLK